MGRRRSFSDIRLLECVYSARARWKGRKCSAPMPKKKGKKGKKAPKAPVFHLCPDCDIRVEKGGSEPQNCSVGVTVSLLDYRDRCCNCGKQRGWPASAYLGHVGSRLWGPRGPCGAQPEGPAQAPSQ